MDSRPAREQAARREELAAFLRARREALQPETVGIPRRGRRRVKGLRRHEVADIAAVSVTWYTWMEQGRDIRTTPQVIDALARALMLDDDEHRYLRRLAGIPITDPDMRLSHGDEGLLQLIDDLSPHPAQLNEPSTDLFAWNRAYTLLFTDPEKLEPQQRNGLWIQLMSDEVRDRLVDWEHETGQAIARFRAEAGKYPGDQRIAELIEDLNEKSEFFRREWVRHEVQGFASHMETIEHPEVGAVRARIVILRPLNHPHLTLMLHQLADDESRERMAKLLSGAPGSSATG